jgi:excisionase family DNA binding protein
MHEPHEPPLLTAAAVGRLLGVDASTVYRMAGDGRLPALRVGRQWRFAAEQVRAALAAGLPSRAGEDLVDGARGGAPAAAYWADLDAIAAVLEAAADRCPHLAEEDRARVRHTVPRLAEALARLSNAVAPSPEAPTA